MEHRCSCGARCSSAVSNSVSSAVFISIALHPSDADRAPTSSGVLYQRQPGPHDRAVIARRDLEPPTQLLDPLAHAGNPDAGAFSADDMSERRVLDATASIFNLQHQGVGVTPQPDTSALAARVPVNVDQRFLNDSKQRR